MSYYVCTQEGNGATPRAYRTYANALDALADIERVVGGPCHILDATDADDRVSALGWERFDRIPGIEHLA